MQSRSLLCWHTCDGMGRLERSGWRRLLRPRYSSLPAARAPAVSLQWVAASLEVETPPHVSAVAVTPQLSEYPSSGGLGHSSKLGEIAKCGVREW